MKPKKLIPQSETPAQVNLEALRRIAPSAFTEVRGEDGALHQRIDFEALRELLGDAIADEDRDRYGFYWVNKQEAKRAAAKPTQCTLRPVLEASLDWETTGNLYIEGDNLEVLKLLQRAYLGRVKVIYIDPPYNTGKDFVYDDDFALSATDYARAAGDVDEEGQRLRKNLDSNPRFHSDWCSMIYSRLLVARTLLSNDGVIFLSIDDREVHHLRQICDEVFGADNFIANIIWERAHSPINLKKHFSPSHDFILCYAKDIELAQCHGEPRTEKADSRYANPDNDPRGVWQSSDISVGPAVAANIYPITTPSGRIVEPPAARSWSLSANAFAERLRDNRIWFGPDGNGVPRLKRFLSEIRKEGITPMTIWKHEKTIWEHDEVGHSQSATQELAELFDGQKYFDYPKPVDLIARCIALYADPDSIILDFFSGSATTAHAVMKLNAQDGGQRRFICVQLPEATDPTSAAHQAGYHTICAIGQERIRRAGRKLKENGDKLAPELDVGFRVLRVDSTNAADVYRAPAELTQSDLFGHVESVKPDRSSLDLLFGCLVDWGVMPSLSIRTEEVGEHTLHVVGDGVLVACFDGGVGMETLRRMADLRPQRALFWEAAFATDADKLNIYELLKQLCSWSEEEAYNCIRVI